MVEIEIITVGRKYWQTSFRVLFYFDQCAPSKKKWLFSDSYGGFRCFAKMLFEKIIIPLHKRHSSLARKMTMKWLEPPPGDRIIVWEISKTMRWHMVYVHNVAKAFLKSVFKFLHITEPPSILWNHRGTIIQIWFQKDFDPIVYHKNTVCFLYLLCNQ